LQVKKVRKQKAGWPGAYDSDLCAQFHDSGAFCERGLFYIHLAKRVDQSRMLARLPR
jgi:hypothetical protein